MAFRSSGTLSERSRDMAASYDGPECRRVLYGLDELTDYDYNAKDTVEDASPEAQVLLAVCSRHQRPEQSGHTIREWPRIKASDPVKTFYALDDRKLDVVAAAVAAVDISAGSEWGRSETRMDERPDHVGLALLLMKIVDPAALEAALAPMALPPAAKTALVADLQAVQAHLGPIAPEQQELLVDLPLAVWRARQAEFKQHDALYTRFDALAERAKAARAAHDGKQAEGVAADLARLRSDFVKACGGKGECTSAPLYGYATRELAQLEVVLHDELAATAESDLFAHGTAFQAGFAQAIRIAQDIRVHQLQDSAHKYRKAKESGTDDATALALAGGTRGLADAHELLLDPPMHLPDYAAALSDHEPSPHRATVARVTREGARAKVVFVTQTSTGEEPYDCHPTGRIAAVHYSSNGEGGVSGSVEYEEDCKYRKVTDTVLTHAAISVPWSEVQAVRSGEELEFVQNGERAAVLRARHGANVVQIRGDRLNGG